MPSSTTWSRGRARIAATALCGSRLLNLSVNDHCVDGGTMLRFPSVTGLIVVVVAAVAAFGCGGSSSTPTSTSTSVDTAWTCNEFCKNAPGVSVGIQNLTLIASDTATDANGICATTVENCPTEADASCTCVAACLPNGTAITAATASQCCGNSYVLGDGCADFSVCCSNTTCTTDSDCCYSKNYVAPYDTCCTNSQGIGDGEVTVPSTCVHGACVFGQVCVYSPCSLGTEGCPGIPR